MDIQKLTKKITWVHVVAAVAIIIGLWYMGLLQAFLGALVVADVEVETAQCRISGEIWSPDTLKCQCPAGYGYLFTGVGEIPANIGQAGAQDIRIGWTCVPLATAPAATAEKPAEAPVEESIYSGRNVMLGIGIILAAVLALFYFRKK